MKKKLVLLIGSLVIAFSLFLYFSLSSHDYEIEYNVDGVKIKEAYHKEDNYYSFTFTNDGIDYNVIALSKYTTKRKLVDKIDVEIKDEETCLSFKTHHVDIYPVCKNKDSFYTPFKEVEFSKKSSYENVEINNLDDKTFLLWNYKDFIYLNSKKQDKISMFSKDKYTLNLVYQTEDGLLVADYNQNYKFDKMYYINASNSKVKEIKLRYEVYFDSYFLGNDKEDVYLYDSKNEQEFYVDLKKEKINKTGFKILVNNTWEKVTNQKLKNSKLSFSNKEVFSYIIEDGNLYASTIYNDEQFKVTNRTVSKIVKTDNLDVYYISKDVLYYFNPLKGEMPLLKYSEWEFNNSNMIYIF